MGTQFILNHMFNAMKNLQIWKNPILKCFSCCFFHLSTWAGMADPQPLFSLLSSSQLVHISTVATPVSMASAALLALLIGPSISISVSK